MVLLALLTERPKHGYEIMTDLTRLFAPRYRASPGSIYPAIEALEAEGLIAGKAHGGKTTYATTAAGNRALESRAELLAMVELRTGTRLARGNSLDPVLARFRARVAPLSGHVDPHAVAAVLERAAAEIEKLNGKATSHER